MTRDGRSAITDDALPELDHRQSRLLPPSYVQSEFDDFERRRRWLKRVSGTQLDLLFVAYDWNGIGDGVVDPIGGSPVMRHRETHGFLMAGESVAGYLRFQELDLPHGPIISDRTFLEMCDCYTHEMMQLGKVFLGGWHVEDLWCGRLVLFDCLWVAHASAHGAWVPIVQKFIRQRWGGGRRAQGALMLLKPFPLEYDTRRCRDESHAFARDQPVSRQFVQIRTAALRRMYGRHLGARPLHKGEWMWSALSFDMKPPTAKPRRVRYQLLYGY